MARDRVPSLPGPSSESVSHHPPPSPTHRSNDIGIDVLLQVGSSVCKKEWKSVYDEVASILYPGRRRERRKRRRRRKNRGSERESRRVFFIRGRYERKQGCVGGDHLSRPFPGHVPDLQPRLLAFVSDIMRAGFKTLNTKERGSPVLLSHGYLMDGWGADQLHFSNGSLAEVQLQACGVAG